LLCSLLGQNADDQEGAIYIHPNPNRGNPTVTSFQDLQRYPDRLLLIRDPRDICVGALHKNAQYGKPWVEPWIEGGPDGAGKALRLACEIWVQCKDEFIIRYEDLCRDPDAAQLRIHQQFGIPTFPLWSTATPETPVGAFGRESGRPINTASVGVWKNSLYRDFAEEYAEIPQVKKYLEMYYSE